MFYYTTLYVNLQHNYNAIYEIGQYSLNFTFSYKDEKFFYIIYEYNNDFPLTYTTAISI